MILQSALRSHRWHLAMVNWKEKQNIMSQTQSLPQAPFLARCTLNYFLLFALDCSVNLQYIFFFLFRVFVPIIFFFVLNVTFLIYVLLHKLQGRSWISDQIVAQYWQDSLNNLHHTDRSERSNCSLAGSWYSECHYSVT